MADTTPPPCGWLADRAHLTDPPPAVVRVQMGWAQGQRRAWTGMIVPLCAACLAARREDMAAIGGRLQVTTQYAAQEV